MKNKIKQNKFTKGFTLIELLVVVLIMGILAAVALPQYKKSVWKTRLTEVYTVGNALEKGIDLYMLTHSISPWEEGEIDPQELEIDVLSNLTKKTIDINTHHYCSQYLCSNVYFIPGPLVSWYAYVYTNSKNGNLIIEVGGSRSSDSGWYRFCYYEDNFGKSLCEFGNWDDVSEGF